MIPVRLGAAESAAAGLASDGAGTALGQARWWPAHAGRQAHVGRRAQEGARAGLPIGHGARGGRRIAAQPRAAARRRTSRCAIAAAGRRGAAEAGRHAGFRRCAEDCRRTSLTDCRAAGRGRRIAGQAGATAGCRARRGPICATGGRHRPADARRQADVRGDACARAACVSGGDQATIGRRIASQPCATAGRTASSRVVAPACTGVAAGPGAETDAAVSA